MQKDNIPHAGLASDLEFIRRVHLDLTGRIPDSEVIRKFINNKDAQKRDKLIEGIVRPERYQFSDSDPFVDRWTIGLAICSGARARN
jgi:hypothetical protein